MNLELYRFITKRLLINNDPISIENCVIAVKEQFGMSSQGAQTAVERVLSERL